MSIEFTFVPGAHRPGSPASVPQSFFFDPRAAAAALDHAAHNGFDTVVVDDASGLLTNIDLAANIARLTPTLGIALTHWAGVMAPREAASAIAALDWKCGGRLSLRMLADGLGDEEGRTDPRPGHLAACQRLDEYVTLLKRLWCNDRPFDHEGPHYSLRGGFVPDKGPRGWRIAVRMGGVSGSAIQVAARHADVFELAAGTPNEILVQMQRVRAAAIQFGRASQIRFALPVRLGHAEAADGPHLAVDGAPARSAVSLLAYAEAGVSEFMVSGGDDPDALARFGQHVVPLLRNSLARRSEFPAAERPLPLQAASPRYGGF